MTEVLSGAKGAPSLRRRVKVRSVSEAEEAALARSEPMANPFVAGSTEEKIRAGIGLALSPRVAE